MTALRDCGKAKLNLSLEVLGCRIDGYHELRSLVTFVELGDTVEFVPSDSLGLAVEGPFAGALRGDNLLIAAAEAAKDKAPGITLGRFRVEKILPVAAGLGGGSADAAAALRILARANPDALPGSVLAEITLHLGSDVTACLGSRPALMTGRGEIVTEVRGMPACGVVLVNPGLPLATATVYSALNAAPLPGKVPDTAEVPDFGRSFERLIAYASQRSNDLQVAALSLVPVIGEVLDALKGRDGARLVRVAGSGPTCFAMFATEAEAKAAAAELRAVHTDWWIEATMLRPN